MRQTGTNSFYLRTTNLLLLLLLQLLLQLILLHSLDILNSLLHDQVDIVIGVATTVHTSRSRGRGGRCRGSCRLGHHSRLLVWFVAMRLIAGFPDHCFLLALVLVRFTRLAAVVHLTRRLDCRLGRH